MGGERLPDDDTSSEEDGDEQFRADINSVSGVVFPPANAPLPEDHHQNPPKLKHYQIKAQVLLSDMLEKSLDMVTAPLNFNHEEEDPDSTQEGVRLFKRAPPGIIFDHAEKRQGPKKKPKIAPGVEVDEKSKKFRKQLKSIAVDGADILAAAEKVRLKGGARLEAREVAAKKEEQRVAELKLIRGERWLPCIAKEKQFQLKIQNAKKR